MVATEHLSQKHTGQEAKRLLYKSPLGQRSLHILSLSNLSTSIFPLFKIILFLNFSTSKILHLRKMHNAMPADTIIDLKVTISHYVM